MMIAAALVGAIGLGGAMAYTYKTLAAPGGGRAPVVKAADFGPNKVKPEVTDGRVVPHTDKSSSTGSTRRAVRLLLAWSCRRPARLRPTPTTIPTARAR